MNLFIYRQDDNRLQKVTHGPGGDFQAAWSPNLQQLAFFSSREGNLDVFVVSTNAGSQPIRLTTHPDLDYNPFFSTDGKHIAFVSSREGGAELYRMNSDGSEQHRVVFGARMGHFIPWYDERSILAGLDVDGFSGYHLIPIDGSPPTPIRTLDFRNAREWPRLVLSRSHTDHGLGWPPHAHLDRLPGATGCRGDLPPPGAGILHRLPLLVT